jgi:hypothetical protein
MVDRRLTFGIRVGRIILMKVGLIRVIWPWICGEVVFVVVIHLASRE